VKQHKFRNAEKAINRALKFEPQNADYLTEIGFVYLALGFSAKANACFEKALKISPDNARASEGMIKTR
jgi:Tfp pilus assembly protein PilF